MGLDILDWLLIGLLTAAVIFLALFLAFLVSFFMLKKTLTEVKERRPKNKKRKKQWIRQIRLIEGRRKRRIKAAILLLILAIFCGAGGIYSKYYQMTNLSDSDSEALVQGYFLVEKIDNELKTVSEADSPKQVQATVYELSARLASYGARVPDGRLSKDGILLLRRLYQSMKELGLNLTAITEASIQDEVIVEEYLGDIEKVKSNQKNVFEYFRINESSLNQDT